VVIEFSKQKSDISSHKQAAAASSKPQLREQTKFSIINQLINQST
jgi:hypothetical protein